MALNKRLYVLQTYLSLQLVMTCHLPRCHSNLVWMYRHTKDIKNKPSVIIAQGHIGTAKYQFSIGTVWYCKALYTCQQKSGPEIYISLEKTLEDRISLRQTT